MTDAIAHFMLATGLVLFGILFRQIMSILNKETANLAGSDGEDYA